VNDRGKKELLLVFSLILASWGILLFFENSYFAAGFYGVVAPSWATWVGDVPLWWFNVIDSVMAAILIIAILLSVRKSRRRLHSASRGSVGGIVLVLVGLFLIAAMLFLLGFNLLGLWTDFKGFLGV
jgi:hypothetical protein